MRGIFDVGAEEKNAAGDRVALERAAPADPFAPAVVCKEALAEIGARRLRSAASRDRRPARRRPQPASPRLGPRGARQAYERGNDGKRARRLRARDRVRGHAKERQCLRASGPKQFPEGGNERAQGSGGLKKFGRSRKVLRSVRVGNSDIGRTLVPAQEDSCSSGVARG